jgi:hypothetical protein
VPGIEVDSGAARQTALGSFRFADFEYPIPTGAMDRSRRLGEVHLGSCADTVTGRPGFRVESQGRSLPGAAGTYLIKGTT